MSNKQFVPRTMKAAFGPYAKLDVEDKPKFPKQHYILPLAILVVYVAWMYVMLVGIR
jgi:hypothetical protein